MKRSPRATLLCALAAGCIACSDSAKPDAAMHANTGGSGGAQSAGSGGGAAGHDSDGGYVDGGYNGTTPDAVPSVPWSSPLPPASALRKVKGVLTGLAPTDAELAAVTKDAGALPDLIDGWMKTPEFQQQMLFFFANAFQQSSLALLDFEFQLRKRPGALDLPSEIFGDDAFPKLFQNMKESFARTCLELIDEKRPFTDVLTTQRFMLTPALKSLYMQIEMPNDKRKLPFKFNHGTRPALEDSLDPKSDNYMTFGYAPPTTVSGKKFDNTCAGDSTKVSSYPGNTYLFQVLLGAVPRDGDVKAKSSGTSLLGCMEHAQQPYFTAEDFSDWQMVTIEDGTPLFSYDLPALRKATTLPSKLPRVSFFTTPSFLAVWNTNDSNQHRVTANQALLVALGQGFTSASASIPVPPTLTAVDGEHAVTTSVCYGCHKSLDPMRQFWGLYYDFNDKNEGEKSTGKASFGFGDVAQDGATLLDFGMLLATVNDTQVGGKPLNRFALAMTQKLCFFANSSKCEETDPEMRRIAQVFVDANYDWKALVRELFASPLVTSITRTETATQGGVTISIARRDQLCAALSNRLGRADLCEIALPAPTDATSAMNRLAGALPADGFSRGSEFPVTVPDPNLFYRAASELVCEAISAKVVDSTADAVFSTSDAQAAIKKMVTLVMGVPASDPKYAPSAQVLGDHYQAAMKTGGATAKAALRSTFSAACQSPATLSLGI